MQLFKVSKINNPVSVTGLFLFNCTRRFLKAGFRCMLVGRRE
jgi:hypothetical protein